jgi:hypothetical protein
MYISLDANILTVKIASTQRFMRGVGGALSLILGFDRNDYGDIYTSAANHAVCEN